MTSLNSTLKELNDVVISSDIEKSIKNSKEVIKLTDKSKYKEWFQVRYDFAGFLIKHSKNSPKYIEDAIELLNILLDNISENEKPMDWAMVNISLGLAYESRKESGKDKNIEYVIKFYKRALRVFTKKDNPLHWAAMKAGIGYKYAIRKTGNQKENIVNAVKYVRDSLEIYTKIQYPDQYWDKMRELARIKTLLNNENVWNEIWDEYESNKDFKD